MDRVQNAKRLTNFSALRVAINHSSVVVLLQIAMLPARHCVNVFF